MFKTYPELQNETDYLKPMKDSYFEKKKLNFREFFSI